MPRVTNMKRKIIGVLIAALALAGCGGSKNYRFQYENMEGEKQGCGIVVYREENAWGGWEETPVGRACFEEG